MSLSHAELHAELRASQARTRERDHAAFERASERIKRYDETKATRGRRAYVRRKPGLPDEYVPPRFIVGPTCAE